MDGRDYSDIRENLKLIRERVAEAAEKSGRKYEDVKIMAVTKTVAPDRINAAIDDGIDLIGENRVQEFLQKKDELKLCNCDVHLIGHLQTNKVKQIVPHVSMIQSVDSVKLAAEISKACSAAGKTMDILLEVNIGQEESKSGFSAGDVRVEMEKILEFGNLKVRGLMSIPPVCDDSKKIRSFFYDLYKLFVDIKAEKIDNINMEILSMGMSSDYYEAILEGSNMVRIGSAIFGRRNYF